MKKSDVNKVLKEVGYEFIKLRTGSQFDNGRCYTDINGKRVKGIQGGSRGPMTMTDTYLEHNEQTIRKVTEALIKSGMYKDVNSNMFISDDEKIKLILEVNYYPVYTQNANYDDAYENAYIQPVFM